MPGIDDQPPCANVGMAQIAQVGDVVQVFGSRGVADRREGAAVEVRHAAQVAVRSPVESQRLQRAAFVEEELHFVVVLEQLDLVGTAFQQAAVDGDDRRRQHVVRAAHGQSGGDRHADGQRTAVDRQLVRGRAARVTVHLEAAVDRHRTVVHHDLRRRAPVERLAPHRERSRRHNRRVRGVSHGSELETSLAHRHAVRPTRRTVAGFPDIVCIHAPRGRGRPAKQVKRPVPLELQRLRAGLHEQAAVGCRRTQSEGRVHPQHAARWGGRCERHAGQLHRLRARVGERALTQHKLRGVRHKGKVVDLQRAGVDGKPAGETGEVARQLHRAATASHGIDVQLPRRRNLRRNRIGHWRDRRNARAAGVAQQKLAARHRVAVRAAERYSARRRLARERDGLAASRRVLRESGDHAGAVHRRAAAPVAVRLPLPVARAVRPSGRAVHVRRIGGDDYLKPCAATLLDNPNERDCPGDRIPVQERRRLERGKARRRRVDDRVDPRRRERRCIHAAIGGVQLQCDGSRARMAELVRNRDRRIGMDMKVDAAAIRGAASEGERPERARAARDAQPCAALHRQLVAGGVARIRHKVQPRVFPHEHRAIPRAVVGNPILGVPIASHGLERNRSATFARRTVRIGYGMLDVLPLPVDIPVTAENHAARAHFDVVHRIWKHRRGLCQIAVPCYAVEDDVDLRTCSAAQDGRGVRCRQRSAKQVEVERTLGVFAGNPDESCKNRCVVPQSDIPRRSVGVVAHLDIVHPQPGGVGERQPALRRPAHISETEIAIFVLRTDLQHSIARKVDPRMDSLHVAELEIPRNVHVAARHLDERIRVVPRLPGRRRALVSAHEHGVRRPDQPIRDESAGDPQPGTHSCATRGAGKAVVKAGPYAFRENVGSATNLQNRALLRASVLHRPGTDGVECVSGIVSEGIVSPFDHHRALRHDKSTAKSLRRSIAV